MKLTLLSIFLSFVEGFLLILSPCILPLIPLILSGSLTGGRSKPFGIITGFVLTFTLFTLFSRLIINWFHIDPTVLRNVAFVLLFLFGIVMMSNYFFEKFSTLSQKLTNIIKPNPTQKGSGFWNGLLFGSLLGVIWTPCAGPLLAAVIVQSVIQKTTFLSVLVTLAFGLGVAIPMLLIALLGRKFTQKFSGLRKYSTTIRRILGVLIIIGAMALYFQNWFTLLASKIKTPSFATYSDYVKPYPAPQIAGITAWINSPPLQLKDLKGKVVLVDLWTYSCINCIRALPYIEAWYEKYQHQGLVIIGVHSPEFAFEKNIDNVIAAVKSYKITYPVALDNNFVTWQNYNASYWPSHYLIDKNGNVVYQQFGEGNYIEMENKIRSLLGLQPLRSSVPVRSTSALGQTPEIYLGFARAANFANTEVPKVKQSYIYRYPLNLPMNSWALQGAWIIQNDKIISSGNDAAIKLHFNAKNVYAVMGSTGKPITLTLFLNGVVQANKIIVTSNRLYVLLDQAKSTSGVLEIKVNNPGLELYTFTFGS